MTADESSKENMVNLIPLINTFWKLKSKISKLEISERQMKPIETYMNSMLDIIKNYGYDIIDYTNKKYNFGDNIDILSVEGDGEDYRIIECIQPTIIQQNDIKQKATVIIKRG